MIRPLHLILNGKTLADITAPIDGKVAELEDFARRKETEAAALAHNSAAEFEAAKARFAQQQDIAGALVVEARTATRIADKLRKVVA